MNTSLFGRLVSATMGKDVFWATVIAARWGRWWGTVGRSRYSECWASERPGSPDGLNIPSLWSE